MGRLTDLTTLLGNASIKLGRSDGFRLEIQVDGIATLVVALLFAIETPLAIWLSN